MNALYYWLGAATFWTCLAVFVWATVVCYWRSVEGWFLRHTWPGQLIDTYFTEKQLRKFIANPGTCSEYYAAVMRNYIRSHLNRVGYRRILPLVEQLYKLKKGR